MKYKLLLLLFAIISRLECSPEYIYPVGSINHKEHTGIFLFYQKSLQQCELWLWNSATNKAIKILNSLYVPAGFRVLPNEEGFSFIDQDKIRIKWWNKRSPKLISFNKPLYNLSVIEWLDDSLFYLSARQRQHFGIFVADIHGNTNKLLYDDRADYMCPRIVEDKLFYILRKSNNTSRIMLTTLFGVQKEELCMFTDIVCNFLYMKNSSEGFFLTFPMHLDNAQTSIEFTCHTLYENNGIWHNAALFSFNIPIQYCVSGYEDSFYESMLPFLPRYTNNTIYFMDTDDKGNTVSIYSYDNQSGEIRKCSSNDFSICCSPCITDTGTVYFGGNGQLYMNVNNDNDQYDVDSAVLNIDEAGIELLAVPSFRVYD